MPTFNKLLAAAVALLFAQSALADGIFNPGVSGVTPSTTVITGGTNTRVLFDDNGVVGESAGLTFAKGNGGTTSTLTIGAATTITGAGLITASSTGGLDVGAASYHSTFIYIGSAAASVQLGVAADIRMTRKAAGVLSIDSSADGNSLGAFAPQTKAGAFVAADFPSGSWFVGRDTSGATTKLYYNNAGTLQSIALAP